MLITLLIATCLLLMVTFLPLLQSNHWLCRVWEFPRVQISTLIFVNILLSLFFLPPIWAYPIVAISIILLCYQLHWVIPFTPLVKAEVEKVSPSEDTPQLKIITTNVLMTNRSSKKLLALVEKYQADVLVTLETNKWWENALKPLHEDYPFRVARALDNLYGMHLYSKYELKNIEVLNLIKEGIPSIHCELQLNDNTAIKCHFIHPEPPSPTESETAKPRDKELMLVANMVKPKEQATIVSGDLNDVAWSPTTRSFREKSALLDPRVGRGFFNTFHAQHVLARWPLDHIFHSDHFRLVELKRLSSIDSDHFPLFSHLALLKK